YIAYTFKQAFIMHALIRPTLVFMNSNFGLTVSFIIPAIFSFIPFAYFTFEFSFFIDPRIAYSMVCLCGLVNLGISIYLMLTGQTAGTSFPLIMAFYELVHTVPEAVKLYAFYCSMDYRAYASIEDVDDLAFFVTVVFAFGVLMWETRQHKTITAASQYISFDNNAAYSN
ncbi:hypothetical protein PENTCL1PPCAC_25687, partial [Pristionchus entomophagus]